MEDMDANHNNNSIHSLSSTLFLLLQSPNSLLSLSPFFFLNPPSSPLRKTPLSLSTTSSPPCLKTTPLTPRATSPGTSIKHLVGELETETETDNDVGVDSNEIELHNFDIEWDKNGGEMRKIDMQFDSPVVEVTELEELPENWRRSKIAWLCKELPSQKRPTQIRLLTAQKKWMQQQDATYIAHHFLRIRLNDAAFSVYKWMIQQHWFRFDFALATKLADCIGRERKFAKCREIYDDIINQGRVPSESTFHILIVAYLSAPGEDCLKEACEIYYRMIHLGAYHPRLSLHNALFRALISKPAISAKPYLKQAEFIFHNLATCGLEIREEIYSGLLWLHSHQDTIDKERIFYLLKEMNLRKIPETKDTLLSILRACSKVGEVDEAEKTWLKLLNCDGGISPQAYMYKMGVYAEVGDPLKSLDIFREMQKQCGQINNVAYQKIIEIMCNSQEVQLAESLMKEFVGSGLKSLTTSYVDLLNMYYKLSLHDKVESTFLECLDKCRPNRAIYGIYLDSLVKTSNIEKAESIFKQMLENEAIGVSSRSCNSLLSGYLACGDNAKAEKLYRFMRQKKYEVESSLMEKLEYLFTSAKKFIEKYVTLKLTPEQREILVGLLLGGLQIEYAGEKKLHFVHFKFKDDSGIHTILKRHIYNEFHEWLQHSNGSTDDSDDIPSEFLTVPHTCFGFYAHQFWAEGKQSIPKLIHRWLTPRVLAYWFMYGGYTTPNGDIFLKVKGSKDDVERVFKALKLKSLEFRIKQKGKVFWLGFMGSHSTSFWRLIEPYLLNDLLDFPKADDQPSENITAEKSSV
ncbi:LOW QUALITY PROTEIN: pentatricopeptide repeat-containing protein At2g15820, chloroplastic-like [Chenopodium quinoa]|uniref:LOW QUALITY PROTEIN: pentatricopeptide repeat-containing protein At2g15820, chloroplastic-like n=1 Tax=Chenopodium quinoa TaxID=63459 RepID=UPI000B78EF31|nr:LOW QUALITY PROTEIN: pentatricopeptide repeat-containing protein At2g15820, chloroplastic-like [Chenopodium quinoa]